MPRKKKHKKEAGGFRSSAGGRKAEGMGAALEELRKELAEQVRQEADASGSTATSKPKSAVHNCETCVCFKLLNFLHSCRYLGNKGLQLDRLIPQPTTNGTQLSIDDIHNLGTLQTLWVVSTYIKATSKSAYIDLIGSRLLQTKFYIKQHVYI